MNTINSFSFQGVNGAYSELAGKRIYPEASSIACKTFEEMFDCVRDGNAKPPRDLYRAAGMLLT